MASYGLTIGSGVTITSGITLSILQGDDYFNLTTLLLPGNGANTAQNNTFQDSSTNNFTITRNPATGPNAPTQGTFSPFSQTGWGNYFDGSGDSLEIADNAAFDMGSQNYTIEGWMYPTSYPASSGIVVKYGPGQSWVIDTSGNNWEVLVYYGASSNLTVYAGALPALNAWHHFVLQRSGANIEFYVDGVRLASVGAQDMRTTSAPVRIGCLSTSSAFPFFGYISNVRIVKGTAVYTSGATITVPTTPLTAISGTSLLTCQSNRFIDNSTNNFTLTVNGNTSVVPFSPFNPTSAWSASTVGGSGYFVYASANYLSSTITVSDFFTALGDFTFEGWVYPLSFNGPQYSMPLFAFSNDDLMLRAMPTSAASTTLNIYGIDSAGGAAFGSSGTSGGTIQINEWAWVVFTRESGVLNLWVNGTRVVNNAVYTSTQLRQTATVIRLGGAYAGTNPYWNGYLSGLKWTSGAALYSGATISMPTAPPTTTVSAGTNRLLLNFTNAGIYDATSKNVLETVGTAQVSDTQAKFGTTSMYFDGTTTPEDLLSTPVLPYSRIGAGDYTLEMWIRPARVNTLQALLTYGSSAFRIFLNSSNIWFLNSSSSIVQYTSVVTTANQWYYLVLVRKGSSGTNCAIFLDGTRLSTGFSNTTDFNTGTPNIGGEGASNLYQGYMQDFRLTRFARYDPASSTITVPTAAFTTF